MFFNTPSWSILKSFFYKDWLIHKQSLKDNSINYGILWPMTFGFSFTVLRKNIFFASSQDAYFGSMILVGSIIVPMMVVAYFVTFDLMFDLESRKHILFQTSIIHPRWVLLQKLVFATCYTFCICMLFFPAAKLFLGNHFIIQHQSWLQLSLFMLLATFAMCAIQQTCAAMLTINKLDNYWIRFNAVLMNMGGTFITTSPLLTAPFVGRLLFLNPVLHMTEGIRGILYSGHTSITVFTCCIYLLVIAIVSILIGWHVFKKRVDHL
ncbi:ABC transporter permease [Candidatus Dependentiae bacterium]|nr:MAG: ABC transporter permease [Candidatus Dependentiae bacterium]